MDSDMKNRRLYRLGHSVFYNHEWTLPRLLRIAPRWLHWILSGLSTSVALHSGVSGGAVLGSGLDQAGLAAGTAFVELAFDAPASVELAFEAPAFARLASEELALAGPVTAVIALAASATAESTGATVSAL